MADETFPRGGAGCPLGITLKKLRDEGATMLYSQSMNIGFAHYPKTAGHSLTRWFREVFPDARLVEPHPLYEVNHLPVRYSLEQLGLVPRQDRPLRKGRRLMRACATLARRFGHWWPVGRPGENAAGRPCATRIIGVVREPFEMLVSLFEYWRSYEFAEEPTQPLIQCARRGTFRGFVAMAVAEGGLANYHDFFDMHGPAAANTRLLDFNALEPALVQVCREFGLDVTESKLGLLNVGPSRHRDLERYRTEVGSLLAEVRAHFRWYYEEGIHVMAKGSVAAPVVTERRRTHRLPGAAGIGQKAEGTLGHFGSRWEGLAIAGGTG
jgi:hypothetical protein